MALCAVNNLCVKYILSPLYYRASPRPLPPPIHEHRTFAAPPLDTVLQLHRGSAAYLRAFSPFVCFCARQRCAGETGGEGGTRVGMSGGVSRRRAASNLCGRLAPGKRSPAGREPSGGAVGTRRAASYLACAARMGRYHSVFGISRGTLWKPSGSHRRRSRP